MSHIIQSFSYSCLSFYFFLIGAKGVQAACSTTSRVPPFRSVQPHQNVLLEELHLEVSQLQIQLEWLQKRSLDLQQRMAQSEKQLYQVRVLQEEQEALKKQIQELKDPESLLKDAKKKFGLKQFSEAIGDFQRYLKLKNIKMPQEAQFLLARCYDEMKNYREAIPHYKRYLKLKNIKMPQEAQFLLARCYDEMKNYREAIPHYNEFLIKYPNSRRIPTIMYQIALIFERSNRKNEAQGFFKNLIQQYPQSKEAEWARKKLAQKLKPTNSVRSKL